jgi:hypothetical protein
MKNSNPFSLKTIVIVVFLVIAYLGISFAVKWIVLQDVANQIVKAKENAFSNEALRGLAIEYSSNGFNHTLVLFAAGALILGFVMKIFLNLKGWLVWLILALIVMVFVEWSLYTDYYLEHLSMMLDV